jgi:hypothetical protein
MLQLGKDCKENAQNETIFRTEKGPKRHTYTVGIVSGTGDRFTHNNKGYELQQKNAE